MVDQNSLFVVVTTGLEDGGRKAAIAIGVALAALANGTQVRLFLSLESARLGAPSGADGVHPRGFSESLSDYIRHFLDLGGKLSVCSSCYEEYCRDLPKDETGRPLLHPGTAIETLAVVARAALEMPVLTF
jgi:predicted peroxiredoxin